MRYREIILEQTNYLNMLNIPSNEPEFLKKVVNVARHKLKKNDRIVWFLLLFRLAYLYTENENDKSKKDAFSNYKREYEKASGQRLNIIELSRIFNNFSTYLSRLEHFLSLPIPSIQQTVFSYQSPSELLAQFKNAEEEWQESRKGLIAQKDGEENATPVIRFPNGYTWWLLDKAYCPLEANAMGHCGNGPRSDSSDRIFSLRQTVKKGNHTFYVPYLTFILDESGYLTEMKGRFNNSPKMAFKKGFAPSDFSSEIVALLKLPIIKGIIGGGYAPQNNFKIQDLSPEQIENLGHEKPSVMPLSWIYKKNGITKELIEIIERKVSEFKQLTYDETAKGFILDNENDLAAFIKRYVKVNRGSNGVAAWILTILQGDEIINNDYYGEDNNYREILNHLEDKFPDEYKKLVEYLENLWKDNEDGDEDILEMIDEVSPDIKDALKNAFATGIDVGTEDEMATEFDKWLNDLRIPTEEGIWINMPEWDNERYDSEVNVMISVPSIIRMIDNGDIEDSFDSDEFKVDDISEPYYGFSGYDKDAALERFREEIGQFVDE